MLIKFKFGYCVSFTSLEEEVLRRTTTFVVSSNFVLLTRKKFSFGPRIPIIHRRRNVGQAKVFLQSSLLFLPISQTLSLFIFSYFEFTKKYSATISIISPDSFHNFFQFLPTVQLPRRGLHFKSSTQSSVKLLILANLQIFKNYSSTTPETEKYA